MANILTPHEAANVLRCEIDDENMLDLLPIVDKYIEQATGRNWTLDTTIYSEAKGAARMLLVRLHEDPGALGSVVSWAFQAALTQLEALALELETSGVPDEALALTSHNMATEMAITANLVLVFNHQMASGSTSSVTLETAAGASVATSNSLDVTSKIMTVNPTASLAAGAAYTVVISAAADIYGQTLTEDVSFWTAS